MLKKESLKILLPVTNSPPSIGCPIISKGIDKKNINFSKIKFFFLF